MVGAFLAAALLAGASPAHAAAKRPRLMLLDLPADKAFEPNALKVVNSFLAKDLRDEGFEVITPSDIVAALGVEKQRQLLGCTDSSCLAELGGAMGADYIIHGELAALERDTALTLTITNSGGQALNEVADVVSGKQSQTLLEAVNRAVPKLVAPLRAAGKIPGANVSSSVVASSSATTAAPDGGSHTASFVALGLGAALLVGSGFTGALAMGSNATLQNAVKGNPPLTSAKAASSLRTTVRAEGWTSTGLMAVGVVAAGVGVVWLMSGSSKPTPVALTSSGEPTLAWAF